MSRKKTFNEIARHKHNLTRQLMTELQKDCASEELCLSLLRKGADPNATDAKGLTPLILAVVQATHIECGWQKFVHALIKKGAKVDYATEKGMTAAKLAVCWYNIRMLNIIGKASGRDYQYADYAAFLKSGGMSDPHVKLPYHRLKKPAPKKA